MAILATSQNRSPTKKKKTLLQTWFVFRNCSLIAKSDNVPHKDLAKFGYYKLKRCFFFCWEKHPSIFLVTCLNWVHINLAIFSSIFSPSIENLKKHMILAL
jgi:hypothetical protein